jgi:hypothetical protein
MRQRGWQGSCAGIAVAADRDVIGHNHRYADAYDGCDPQEATCDRDDSADGGVGGDRRCDSPGSADGATEGEAGTDKVRRAYVYVHRTGPDDDHPNGDGRPLLTLGRLDQPL